MKEKMKKLATQKWQEKKEKNVNIDNNVITINNEIANVKQDKQEVKKTKIRLIHKIIQTARTLWMNKNCNNRIKSFLNSVVLGTANRPNVKNDATKATEYITNHNNNMCDQYMNNQLYSRKGITTNIPERDFNKQLFPKGNTRAITFKE